MILSGEIKLRKTIKEQSGFITDKRFSVETESYTEESFDLLENEEKDYTPDNGIIIFCNELFTLTIYGNDHTINKFFACYSNVSVTIKNTIGNSISFSVYTF